jgi:hypothetical protein
MMTFRPHSVIAVMLFSTMLYAQSSSPASTPQASAARAPSGNVVYPVMSEAAKQRGRKLFEMFMAGQVGAIWASSPPEAKKNPAEEKRFMASIGGLRSKLGTETKMVQEAIVPYMTKRVTVYTRLSEFSNTKVPVATIVMINENGYTDGFTLRPLPSPPEGHNAGYKDTTKFKLPFADKWLVYLGGHGLINNGYQQTEDQQFAMDFILLKNGVPFSGDATTNEQFYCFGQPVLAPADGTVVRVVNDIGDNPPGQPSPDKPNGNMIVISHGNKEYSLLTNLKQNSIKLKHGDIVKQGDQVGKCGNSGSSTVPKIHYQMQNSAGFPSTESLPVQFVDYIADGKPVAEGEVVRGQMVSNGAASSAPQPAQKK